MASVGSSYFELWLAADPDFLARRGVKRGNPYLGLLIDNSLVLSVLSTHFVPHLLSWSNMSRTLV